MPLSGLKRCFINTVYYHHTSFKPLLKFDSRLVQAQTFTTRRRRPLTLSVPQCRCWCWPDCSLCPRAASSSSSTRATDEWRRRRRRFTGPNRAAAAPWPPSRRAADGGNPACAVLLSLRDLEISSLSIPFFRMIADLSLSLQPGLVLEIPVNWGRLN